MQLALDRLLREQQQRAARRSIDRYFPDDGPLRRELYVKHLEFFHAGAVHRERLALAANRVGKTEGMGGYETALHLTGEYPDWWEGRRFDKPIRAWTAGDTNLNVRDIQQRKLLGPFEAIGTGLIPADNIKKTTRKVYPPDSVQDVYVKHASGGTSVLTLKSYEQGRESFQGDEIDLVWLDEEPPMSIYTECLLRTMTTGGMVMCTFTPLKGISEVVLYFMPDLAPQGS